MILWHCCILVVGGCSPLAPARLPVPVTRSEVEGRLRWTGPIGSSEEMGTIDIIAQAGTELRADDTTAWLKMSWEAHDRLNEKELKELMEVKGEGMKGL
eukprot:7213282-Lingulodinium_polyedra.AAC.1